MIFLEVSLIHSDFHQCIVIWWIRKALKSLEVQISMFNLEIFPGFWPSPYIKNVMK